MSIMNSDTKKEVNVELIKSILCNPTFSGKNRLERIIENNSWLRPKLISADSFDKQVEILISWNNEMLEEIGIKNISMARSDITNYFEIINFYSKHLDTVIDNLDILRNFNYRFFVPVVSRVTDKTDSKIIRRINNTKLIFEFCKEFESQCKSRILINKMEEIVIREITYQRGFMYSLLKNLDMFPNEYFVLGLLLFDIPGDTDPEEQLEINKMLKGILN